MTKVRNNNTRMSLIKTINQTKLLQLSPSNQKISNELSHYITNPDIIFYLIDNNLNHLYRLTDGNNKLVWDVWMMKDMDRYYMIDQLIANIASISKEIEHYQIELSKKIIKSFRCETYQDFFTTDYMACCIMFWAIKHMYISHTKEEFEVFLKNYKIFVHRILQSNNITHKQRFTLEHIRNLLASFQN